MSTLFAKVKDDGKFESKDVPAGKHKLIAWDPVAGQIEIEKEIEVKEGGSVKTDFDIK